MYIILFIVIAYLLGSIPSALIVGKISKNIDIREHGSKNAGTTNVMRTLGKKAGIIVYLGDVLKVVVAIFVTVTLLSYNEFKVTEFGDTSLVIISAI